VVCQLDRLCQSFPSSIRDILDDLPTTLDETYKRILLEIPEEKWKHASRLLQCLFVSFRPLRAEELAEVLAVRFDSEDTPDLMKSWREADPEDALLSACSSLISVVEVIDSRVVQFSHFSVKEFLNSDRLANSQDINVSRYHIPPEPAHKILAQACLSTLLHLGDGINEEGLKDYPLALYAARNWVDHARFGDVSSSLRVGMEQLFNPSKPHFSAWIWIYDMDRRSDKRAMMDLNQRPSQPKATPLYYAAACGFRSLAERLIAVSPGQVNVEGGCYVFPLHVASHRGHVDVIRLLLEHGADVNAKANYNRTSLHFASELGHIEVMQLLLEKGADVNSTTADNKYPLVEASQAGQLKAVQVLVQHGADVNVHGVHGCTPLHRASWTGRLEVIRFLLEHGADVDARDNDRRTTLHHASSHGQLEIVRLLLEHGADINAHGKKMDTPLHRATAVGELEVARCLLHHGAKVDARDSDGRTTLDLAFLHGQLEIVRLLEHEADVVTHDER
jgi:ankyrin repeat protein